jgi:hypothetical protein
LNPKLELAEVVQIILKWVQVLTGGGLSTDDAGTSGGGSDGATDVSGDPNPPTTCGG